MTDYNGTVSFAYDEWGRMTSRTRGAQSQTYEYGFGSKMTKVVSTFPGQSGTVDYMYGAAGKRRWRIVDGVFDRGYKWDVGFNVISENDVNGTLTKTYVVAPKPVGAASPGAATDGILVTQGPVGMILAEITGSNPATGNGRYYTQDNIQSTRGVFDDSAGSLGAFEYTPFGSGYTSGGPADVTHRYTGLDLDPLTGQYYAPYRYYDPTSARWLTRDPLGMVDGTNVYGNVMANPVTKMDVVGADSCRPAPIIWPIACICKKVHKQRCPTVCANKSKTMPGVWTWTGLCVRAHWFGKCKCLCMRVP